MSTRRAVARSICLAGCVTTALGFHGIMSQVIPIGGSCGYPGSPACPDQAVWYLAAASFGFSLCVIVAVIADPGYAISWPMLGIGVGSLLAGFQLPAGQRSFPVQFGAVFAAIGAIPLLLGGIGWLISREPRPRKVRTRQRDVIGTVTGVWPTGVPTGDGQPELRVRYRIERGPLRQPSEAETVVRASRGGLPQLGQRYRILLDRKARTIERVGGRIANQGVVATRHRMATWIAASDQYLQDSPTERPAEPGRFAEGPTPPFTGERRPTDRQVGVALPPPQSPPA